MTEHAFVPGTLESSLCDLCWEEPSNPVHTAAAPTEQATQPAEVDELSTRDKLAATLAAFNLVSIPFGVADLLAPYVEEWLAAAREDGYREAMGYPR